MWVRGVTFMWVRGVSYIFRVEVVTLMIYINDPLKIDFNSELRPLLIIPKSFSESFLTMSKLENTYLMKFLYTIHTILFSYAL